MKISAIQNGGYINLYSKKVLDNNKHSKSNSVDNSGLMNYLTVLSFQGKQAVKLQRAMYHHITSSGAKGSNCGQLLDSQFYSVAKYLFNAKQTCWIVNPLSELTEDGCPYNALGRMSKNKYMVNLKLLTTEKYGNLLTSGDWLNTRTGLSFTQLQLKEHKDPLFRRAYENFLKLEDSHPLKSEYNKFCQENDAQWLHDYAIFNVVSKRFNSESWQTWDKTFKTAPEDAKEKGLPLDQYIAKLMYPNAKFSSLKNFKKEIGLYKFEQFLVDKQLKQSVNHLKKRNIQMISDFAIGVHPYGVDTWLNKDMFLFDKEKLEPIVVTGCPSSRNGKPYTQAWGHAQGDFSKPEYWDYLEKSLKQLLEFSIVRLDHFAAYVKRAELPYTAVTPDGRVLKGKDIFQAKPQGMGEDYYDPSWEKEIITIQDPRTKEPANIIDMFIRLAGKKGSKNSYVIESLGKLTESEFYDKNFKQVYGKDFVGQIVIFPKYYDDKKLIEQIKKEGSNIAVLSGNHDKATLMEYLRTTFEDIKKGNKTVETERLKNFANETFGMTVDSYTDLDDLHYKMMEWFYRTFDGCHLHTTMADSLGIEARINVPGITQLDLSKYMKSNDPDDKLALWSETYEVDWLEKTNKSGACPQYRDRKVRFIDVQNKVKEGSKV
ncbi:4-alpha-glucanotransferase [bacterium]|nr:4-alpha-glucanotransferase [bacterium]